ncbi:hypothetical protein [Sphingobacterium sp. BN32]|uniref:hypothetical protein n=1 Tax=Sphingobacterium sp. BN32 TaxID=3058432 RepID=UPI00265CA639|nr:hypothetical protein [Sphingobacterium sp. BN32]WKK60039.1 hypothetical protein QYC40_07280 [Sphingobacterium sp. BN32]
MGRKNFAKYITFTKEEKKSFSRNYSRYFIILGIIFLLGLVIAHGFNYDRWPIKFFFYLVLFPLLMAFFKKVEKTNP